MIMEELMGMYLNEIKETLTAMGEKPFRAEQVFSWLQKGVPFEKMNNLSLALRNKLAAQFIDMPVSILEKHVSRLDGTIKLLYGLKDGNCVEGVLMRYHYGCTLCVSTQVGCKMGCRFCASTLDGCVRNLSAAEILGQIHCANAILENETVHNVVLMGSGEPLDNYDNVVRFLRLATDEKGLNIGVRHISLSTCGLVPQMLRFSQEGLPVTLSLSLHAPDDETRKLIMPIAQRYTVKETIDACRVYLEKTGRRIIFEYALIDHVNASPEHAEKLADLLRGLQCHVNLIPLNTVKERNLYGVTEKQVALFLDTLEKRHISATRRREMGDDIQGACGQLRKSYIQGGNV